MYSLAVWFLSSIYCSKTITLTIYQKSWAIFLWKLYCLVYASVYFFSYTWQANALKDLPHELSNLEETLKEFDLKANPLSSELDAAVKKGTISAIIAYLKKVEGCAQHIIILIAVQNKII